MILTIINYTYFKLITYYRDTNTMSTLNAQALVFVPHTRYNTNNDRKVAASVIQAAWRDYMVHDDLATETSAYFAMQHTMTATRVMGLGSLNDEQLIALDRLLLDGCECGISPFTAVKTVAFIDGVRADPDSGIARRVRRGAARLVTLRSENLLAGGVGGLKPNTMMPS